MGKPYPWGWVILQLSFLRLAAMRSFFFLKGEGRIEIGYRLLRLFFCLSCTKGVSR